MSLRCLGDALTLEMPCFFTLYVFPLFSKENTGNGKESKEGIQKNRQRKNHGPRGPGNHVSLEPTDLAFLLCVLCPLLVLFVFVSRVPFFRLSCGS